MTSNSDNSRRGREFQKFAARVLGEYWSVGFDLEVPFLIGKPAKAHKFDMASSDKKIVGEAKNITWTESGNMPSAKMAFTNQAVLYLWHLPAFTKRFVVMPKDIRPKTGEALADYYHRTYKHLLNGVLVVEIDVASSTVRILGDAEP